MNTAQEVQERIEAFEIELVKKEKRIAKEKINAAIKQCRSECLLGIVISEATEKWLESFGCKIEFVDSSGDDYDTKVTHGNKSIV